MNEKIAKELIDKLLDVSSELDELEVLSRNIDIDGERSDFQKVITEMILNGPSKLIEYICYQYPLLSPYKSKLPPQKAMDTVGFDISSPWHANAHIFFGFMCHQCKKKLTYDDVKVGNTGEKLLEFCVAVTDTAKKRGWSHVGEYTFLCPDCSRNHDERKNFS